MSKEKTEAAIQGTKAAWWPTDSWARLIFTLEPEGKTNLTNGKSLKSRNQVTSGASGMCSSPSPDLLPEAGSLCGPAGPAGPALGKPSCTHPGCRPLYWVGAGDGNRVGNSTGWAPSDPSQPLSPLDHPPCHGQTRASPISEMNQDPP